MLNTRSATIEHTDVATGLAYAVLIEAFEQEVGRWDAATAQSLVQRKAPWSDVEAAASRAGGARGLMIIEAINQGVVTSLSGRPKLCRLYLVGNPAIASGILDVCGGRSFSRVPKRLRSGRWAAAGSRAAGG